MSQLLRPHASARARARARHVPIRRCAGCGRTAAQADLQRMALSADGNRLEWRRGGGRGTYLHPARMCAELFLKGRKLLPGLRARIGRIERQELLASAPFLPTSK